MSTPFTKVTPQTAINDPVIWRELLISIAERAPENDVSFTNTAGHQSLQAAVDAIYNQMGENPVTANDQKGVIQGGQFWNTALNQVVGFSVTAGLTVEPQVSNGTVVFSEGDGYETAEPYRIVTGNETPQVWTGIKLFRKVSDESDLPRIYDDDCPRGFLTKGDILGWWTLEDLQRALSVIRYHHYGSFGTIAQGSSTKSGRATSPQQMAGFTSRTITKTIYVWDHPEQQFPINDTLQRTIGPTIEPISSFSDGDYDFGNGSAPYILSNNITVEYDWTYFGVQP